VIKLINLDQQELNDRWSFSWWTTSRT
jgi:hypothetical protein